MLSVSPCKLCGFLFAACYRTNAFKGKEIPRWLSVISALFFVYRIRGRARRYTSAPPRNNPCILFLMIAPLLRYLFEISKRAHTQSRKGSLLLMPHNSPLYAVPLCGTRDASVNFVDDRHACVRAWVCVGRCCC